MSRSDDFLSDAMAELSPQARRRLVWVLNVLTVMRFALTAIFPLVSSAMQLAAAIAAGVSDFADGYIARRFGLTSWIGGVLDAIADKAFTTTALVTLAIQRDLHFGWIAAIFARDVTVLLIAIWTAANRRWEAFRRMPSRPLGKWTTLVVFLAIACVLVLGTGHIATTAALLLAGMLSVAAAGDYLVRFVLAIRGEKRSSVI